MVSIVKEYLKEIWSGLGYHAAWLPNSPIALGDVGVLSGGRFEQVTSLKALGIPAGVEPPGRIMDLSYASKEASHGSLRASVDADGAARGGYEIKFGRAGAVLFVAKRCRTARIADLDALGRTLIERSKLNQWKREYHVVTEVVSTGPVTILVANDANCSVELAANAHLLDVSALADVEISLSIERSSGLAASLVGQSNITPLFALRALRSRLLGGAHLVTRSSGREDFAIVGVENQA
jgi:hypothetical protein